MSLPDLTCACATARRASRLVTRRYDHHLRPFGLEATQYALLSMIEAQPGVRQIALGTTLGLEKATLSRNLGLMERKGWVEGMTLTAAGRDLVRRARVGWSAAQAELQGTLGDVDWDAMRRGMRVLTDAVSR
jgi:hypothetical protein